MKSLEQGEFYSSSQPNEQNQEGLVETYPYETHEEKDIRKEASSLEDIGRALWNKKMLTNHTASCYMHSWNEHALIDMHDFEVVDVLGSKKVFHEISTMPKVNPWAYPQPKPYCCKSK